MMLPKAASYLTFAHVSELRAAFGGGALLLLDIGTLFRQTVLSWTE